MARWQDQAQKAGLMDELNPVRRVTAGLHDVRFDGLADLMLRAHGRSVLDIGCNRGHTLYDFALNGAKVVHGCDIYGPGMAAARQWFAEVRQCESQFEVVDLTKGAKSLRVFSDRRYSIVLMLGVYHKIKREMPDDTLYELMCEIGRRAVEFFGWSGYLEEVQPIDEAMKASHLKKVAYSEIAGEGHPAVIWRREV